MNVKAQQRSYSFSTFGIDQGLSTSTVQCFLKDQRGFIWIGTSEGLNRYNGLSVEVFDVFDGGKHSLKNGFVFDLAEDKKHDRIYVATIGGGLSVFDPVKEEFSHFEYDSTENSILSDFIYDIEFDHEGRLWAATSHGISILDYSTGTFENIEHDPNNPLSIPNEAIVSMAITSNGDKWFGTYGQGLLYYDEAEKTFKSYLNDAANFESDFHNFINCIFERKDGNLLIATEGGVFAFDVTKRSFKPFGLTGQAVTSIKAGKGNDLWIGTAENGLYYFKDGKEHKLFKHNAYDPYSIASDYILSLYKDDHDMLWVGTRTAGFVRFNLNENSFQHYYDLPGVLSIKGNSVFGLAEDGMGNVWVGTLKGLTKCSPGLQTYTSIDLTGDGKDIIVWNLHYEKDGILHIATSNGYYRYNTRTNTKRHYVHKRNDETTINDSQVNAFGRDSIGRLWVGTAYGVCRYDAKKDQFIRYKPREEGGLSSMIAFSFYLDRKGRFWVLTDHGLNLYNYETDTFTHFFSNRDVKDALSSSSVTEMAEDEKGRLWVAGSQGVDRLSDDLKVVERFNVKHGLSNHNIYGILPYKSQLWVSTNQGISCIDMQSKVVRNFNKYDGLQGNEFNTASHRFKDGRMGFGGINGFNIFHPDSVEMPTFEPPIYFTGLQLYGNKISVRDTLGWKDVVIHRSLITASRLAVSHKERYFTLEFSALDYNSPEKVEYFYRMLPNSTQWIKLHNQRQLTFINLSPGNYELEVRSTNSAGYICNNVKRLTIEVHPPLWQESWFIAMGVFLVIVLVLLMIRYRLRKLRRDKISLEHTIEKRTREIGIQRNIAHKQRDEIARQKAQLEQLAQGLEDKVKERTYELEKAKLAAEESDRLKSAFLSNMSHEIRTPMNAIMGFSELLLDAGFNPSERIEFAKMIKSNGDELLNLLNDIIDISMIESGQLKIAKSEVDVNVAVDQVYQLFKSSPYLQGKAALELTYETPKDHVYVVTDAFRLKQILNNLVSNALKFTDEGSVKLGFELKEHEVLFYVEDTGIGIDLLQQKRIFERFLKVKNDVSNLYRGNGLGLTITKNLVELLGGKIGVHSQEGVGSTFYFTLPLD